MKSASVDKVYGDPIETQGKTIIPVARVAYGFGGGAGRPKHHNGYGAGDDGEEPEAGGGGGGAVAAPYGVLEVTPDGTKLIRFGDVRRTLGAVALGLLFGVILSSRRKHKND